MAPHPLTAQPTAPVFDDIQIADATVSMGTHVWCKRDDHSIPFHGRILYATSRDIDATVYLVTAESVQHAAAAWALFLNPFRLVTASL